MSENKLKPRKPVVEIVEKSFDQSNRPKTIIKTKRWDVMTNKKDDNDSDSEKPIPRKPVTEYIERGSPKNKNNNNSN